ncbi:MAG TPA: YihY/virulence factor BrkB family protein [Ktedonobacteraceae bacterium]|nr:YihY/virulence factor BrkB family protein [Ktedonobacteraceae bacterium]
MTTNAKTLHTTDKHQKESGPQAAIETATKDVKPFMAFWTKFQNDWSMNLSAALAYNLLMAIIPIAIAALAILGIVLGSLSPSAYDTIRNQITNIFPHGVSSQGVLDSVSKQLNRDSGILGAIAIVLALFNGSRLFILIEGCFGIIYHVRQRKFIQQNLMALGMLVLFIVLIPVMVFAAAAPTFILSLIQNIGLSFPGGGFLAYIVGIIGGLIATYILFQAIYIVVPNQKISWRKSWLGSVVAAVLLQIYLILFPLYVAHFLTGYAASISSIIILLIFFYYFAVILMLGAEVNAFFAEGITSTPTDLVSLVHISTSHLPKTSTDKEQQAAQSHKKAPMGDAAAKTHLDDTMNNPDLKASAVLTTATAPTDKTQQRVAQAQAQAVQDVETKASVKKAKKEKAKKTSGSPVSATLVAIAGTALAFVVELVRLRRRKAV